MSLIAYDAEAMLNSITEDDMDSVKFLGKDIQDLVNALNAKEKDKKIFQHDMGIITLFVTVRGTNMQKIESRTSEKGIALFKKLTKKYGIVPHSSSVPMKTPTLPRIASLFPLLTMHIRMKYKLPVIGDKGTIKPEFCFPAAGALLTDDAIEDWLGWYQSFCAKVGINYIRENAILGHNFSTVPLSERFSSSDISDV